MSGAAAQFTDAQIQEFKVSPCAFCPFPSFSPFFFLLSSRTRPLAWDASGVFGGMCTQLWVAGGLQAVRQG